MRKGIAYKDLSNPKIVYFNLLLQCENVQWIQIAFKHAWSDFETKGFKYDGATFVRENNDDFWEVAAFIHDWMNSIGYVGKRPDLYFIRIMIALNYSENLIFERCKWMQWTWLNVLHHKFIKRDFVADGLPMDPVI